MLVNLHKLRTIIVVASQLASMARIVAEGHVRDVPEHWTMAELAMKLITSRIGSSEVQVAIAQAGKSLCLLPLRHTDTPLACLRAHVTQALATAEAARVAGLEQQAEDKLNIDDTIERAKVALDEATAAIDAIPAPAKKSFVATLAPEFAHLAGEMEEGDGKHPPKPSFSGVPRDVVGFCCTGCKTYNLVRAGGNEWYSVYVGNAVGVFHGRWVTLLFLPLASSSLSEF